MDAKNAGSDSVSSGSRSAPHRSLPAFFGQSKLDRNSNARSIASEREIASGRASLLLPSGFLTRQRVLLCARQSHTHMLVGGARHHAAARRAVEKADLNQVRLDDLFD
jgi:hypothetical protein